MASSIYDTLRLHQSSAAESDRPDFVATDKQTVAIYDSQGGSYNSGQISFDLNAITSSSSFLDWQSSYLTIPIEASLDVSTTTWTAAMENQFALSLKNSNLCLINGMTVTLANQQVVTLQQLSQIPIIYKLLTQFNANDQDVVGPSFGFRKDTSASMRYDASLGEVNNIIAPAAVSLANPYPQYNAGRLERMTLNGPICDADTAIVNRASNLGYITPESLRTNYRNWVTNGTVNASTGAITAGQKIVYTIMCNIPMKYVHDLFMKTPLIRGALWQITFHTHIPASFSCAFSAANPSVISSSAATTMNGFMPFMLSPIAVGGAATGLAATAAGTMRLTTKIGNTNTGSTGSCVLNCTMYNLSASVVTKYVANPMKTIVYEDFIISRPASLLNIPAGGNVRANITAGIARARWMLIVPYLEAAQNGSETGVVGVMSAFNSPWTSTGGGTTSRAVFDSFNVTVAGKSIYDRNFKYTYDHYAREQFGINTMNGNAVDGLRTGLISEDDWNKAYCHVAVNLERHPESSDKLPASVDVEFVNQTTRIMSYVVYLFYEKELTIDILTGKMVV